MWWSSGFEIIIYLCYTCHMSKRKTKLAKVSDAKLVSWQNIAPKSVFPLGKGSQAGVVLDRAGAPRYFVFNTNALLDVLSEIDEPLADRLSSEEYYSKTANPAGWLIDELEKRLPLSLDYVDSLKSAIGEAQKKGWISFQKIETELSRA